MWKCRTRLQTPLRRKAAQRTQKFAAAVTLGERAGNLKDLINLAQNLDCYWIYPTVQNEEDYGYYLIDELDELELPEEAKKYFMYEEYGRDAAINDGGRFTEQGYIYNNKNTFTEWYNGRESDIPKEYKIKENKVTKIASGFLGVVVLIALVAGGIFYAFAKQKQRKQAEKEALDPDANYTEDKGDFEIPTEDEPEEPGEEDTEPI